MIWDLFGKVSPHFNFFLISSVTALPGLVLLWWVAPWKKRKV